MAFSILFKRLTDISSMCIVIFIRVRDRKSATYPHGKRSWLRQHFANDKDGHANGQWELPSYKEANEKVEREALGPNTGEEPVTRLVSPAN